MTKWTNRMANWRDSARVPQFFFVDGQAAFPLLLFLLHIRLWTFLVASAATLFFTLLKRYGFTVPVFWRWFLGIIGGSYKSSMPWWKK